MKSKNQATKEEERLPYKRFHSGPFYQLMGPSRRWGYYWEAMGKLLGEGFQPASVADVVRAIVDAHNSDDPAILKGLQTTNNCIFKDGTYYDKEEGINKLNWDTVDAVYFLNDCLKIQRDSRILKNLSSESRAAWYGISRENGKRKNSFLESYRGRGTSLRYDDVEESGINCHLSREQAISHPIWRALVNDDYLLEEYIKIRFSQSKKKRENYETYAMGVFTHSLDKSMTHFVHVSGSGDGASLVLKPWFYRSRYNLLGYRKTGKN